MTRGRVKYIQVSSSSSSKSELFKGTPLAVVSSNEKDTQLVAICSHKNLLFSNGCSCRLANEATGFT